MIEKNDSTTSHAASNVLLFSVVASIAGIQNPFEFIVAVYSAIASIAASTILGPLPKCSFMALFTFA